MKGYPPMAPRGWPGRCCACIHAASSRPGRWSRRSSGWPHERATPAADLLERGSMQAEYGRAERAAGRHGLVRAGRRQADLRPPRPGRRSAIRRRLSHGAAVGRPTTPARPGSTSASAPPRASPSCSGSALRTWHARSSPPTTQRSRRRSATWTRSPATACVATTVTGQGHPGGDQRVHRERPSGTAPAAPTTRCCTPTWWSPTSCRALTGAGRRCPPASCSSRPRRPATCTSAPRAELSRRLGLEWTRVVKGTAEPVGIPRELVEALSKRRAQIVARIALLAQRTQGLPGRGPARPAGQDQARARRSGPVRPRTGADPAPASLDRAGSTPGFDPRRLDQLGQIAQARAARFDPSVLARAPARRCHRCSPGARSHHGVDSVGIAGLERPGPEQLAEQLAGPRGPHLRGRLLRSQ